jgi:hypothetical protein
MTKLSSGFRAVLMIAWEGFWKFQRKYRSSSAAINQISQVKPFVMDGKTKTGSGNIDVFYGWNTPSLYDTPTRTDLTGDGSHPEIPDLNAQERDLFETMTMPG